MIWIFMEGEGDEIKWYLGEEVKISRLYVHIWRNVGTGKVLSIGMYLNSEHVIKGPKWPINVTQKTFQNSLLIVGSNADSVQHKLSFWPNFPRVS